MQVFFILCGKMLFFLSRIIVVLGGERAGGPRPRVYLLLLLHSLTCLRPMPNIYVYV